MAGNNAIARLKRRIRPRARWQAVSRRLRRSGRRVANRRSAPQDSPLIAAVRAGRLDEVERLVAAGVDLNGANARGQTALHVAALLGNAEIAGALLAHGADHGRRDGRGRRALDPAHADVEVLHAVRQRYLRYRPPAIRAEQPQDEVVARTFAALERDGIVRLEQGLDTELLAQLRADFAEFVAELDASVASGATYSHYDEEAYYWPEDRAYITNNAFKHSAALTRLSISSTMAEVARLYLGKPAYIQRAVGMRYLPAESASHHMFRFHHDLVDRRLKMMVLLTAVGDDDQYMSYVVGSNSLFHPYAMFRSNPCSLEYCERRVGKVEIFDTKGRAGDVFLFDSNGAHKGNRTAAGRTRDAYFVEFSPAGRPQFGGDIPPEVFEHGPPTADHPLYVMANSPKVWEQAGTRRTAPTWIVDLPDPSRWVWDPPAPSEKEPIGASG